METDLQASTTPDNLPPHLAENLQRLQPGTYCRHRSWGFGRIKEWNTLGQMIVDFEQKKGHLMQLEYAAQTLTSVGSEDVLALKSSDPAALKKKAKDEPAEVVRLCIQSLGDGANAENIQKVLSPDVIPAEQWKKWWDGAKRAMRKDGHFYIPTRKSEAFRALEAPSALGQQALENLRLAVGYKALVNALVPLTRHWPEIKNQAIADEVRDTINKVLIRMPRTQLPQCIELALARDEFLAETGQPAEVGQLSVIEMAPKTAGPLSTLLEALPGSRQNKLLQCIREGFPNEWPILFTGLLPRANGRVAQSVTESFVEAGRGPEIVTAVNRLLRERSVTCDFLHWFCKSREELFKPLLEPQLMMAILSVLEQDQLSEIKKGTKLYELVLGDKELITMLLRDAAYEDVRDITRAILLSPVFEELDRRSLLANIIKLYPDVQAMIVSEKSSEDATLIVSWESLERRKSELEEITTKKIPENSREIGIARSYGDLRENHEFKAAKEMQTVLMRRKAELESMLSRAQGTDFSAPDTSSVNVGTRVTLSVAGSPDKLVYSILGAWDSDPVKGIISYLTPVAKALIKRQVGDTMSLPGEGKEQRQVTIEKIEAAIK